MSGHPSADLLNVADGDAALRDPDVARMRGLVTAMPAELCEDHPAAVDRRTRRQRRLLLLAGGAVAGPTYDVTVHAATYPGGLA